MKPPAQQTKNYGRADAYRQKAGIVHKLAHLWIGQNGGGSKSMAVSP